MQSMGAAQFTQRWSRDVLLVEDDDDFREGLADILRSEGYVVRCAANGLEALRILEAGETAPKVILLDLVMPVMNGWDFRKRMLAEAHLAHIPVILLSAADHVRGAAEGMNAAGVLNKPVPLGELLRMIEGQLLDTCASCRAPADLGRKAIVVEGSIAIVLCAACSHLAPSFEVELSAVLDRMSRARS